MSVATTTIDRRPGGHRNGGTRLVVHTEIRVHIPCRRLVRSEVIRVAEGNSFPRVGIETKVEEVPAQRQCGGPAACEPIIVDAAMSAEVRRHGPVVHKLRKSGTVPPVTGLPSAVIPRPPFAKPQVAHSRVTIRRGLSPQNDTVRTRDIAAGLKAQVISFKPRAHSPYGGIDRHVSRLAIQIYIAGPALHRPGPGTQRYLARIRPLKVMLWRTLQRIHSGRATRDPTLRELSSHNPVFA